MKLATTTGDFAKFTTQEQSIKYIAEAGFKYIDYNFGTDYRKKDAFFGNNPEEHLKSIKSLAEELELTFVQAHAPMGKPLTDPELVEATKFSIKLCAELGIKNLVVHADWEEGMDKEESFAKNKIFFDDILKVAEEYNINILLENFNIMCLENTYWADNAPDILKLVELVNHPLFHICWDTGHGNQQPLNPYDALKILGDHVYALHVHDNEGLLDSHLIPFFGNLNFDALMHGLLEIGYKGYFTFEADNMFLQPAERKPFPDDERLKLVPLELRVQAESLLYNIGKHILTSYDCFEE